MGKDVREKIEKIRLEFENNVVMDNLNEYVEERKMPLIAKAIIEGKTAKYLRKQFGVKDSATLNLLTGNTHLQDGKNCEWTPGGENTFSQRKLETALIKVQKKFCDKDFWQYYMNYMVEAAATGRELPFEEELLEYELALIQEANEKLIWQGNKDSADENLNKIDGLIKLINLSSYTNANLSDFEEITETNVIDVMRDVYNAIPEILIGKIKYFFTSSEIFRKYKAAITSSNLYHYDPKEYSSDEMPVIGTEVTLVRIPGLTGVNNRVFAALWDQEVFLGTDMLSDSETIDFWYSRDNRQHRMEVGYNIGVQFAFPENIVAWTPASTIYPLLTTPADNGTTNKLTGFGRNRTAVVNVANNTASVVLTINKREMQLLAKDGEHASFVTLGGTSTAATVTINTNAIKATGGTYNFQIWVSEIGYKTMRYNVSVIVAAP